MTRASAMPCARMAGAKAARLCSHAQPAQSLASNAVAEPCIGKGLNFQDLGEVALKGFAKPVRVHAVQ
ncbi:MAG TPA: hypothetical protein VF304_07665 [Casimicrobiaceae bacterium]